MIRSVAIENFGPFRSRTSLPLADQGLVLIKGRNLVSAAMDANGVGKTSILHAIAWGLFGEDMRGRKHDEVACRFTKGRCEVQIIVDDALGSWGVLRTRRPASLITTGIPGVGQNDDMKVTQAKIEQRLGFGVRTFMNAVIFGQGAFDRFAQADQAEKMRMLDEIQGVDLRDALASAKAWRDDLLRKADEAAKGAEAHRLAAEMRRAEVRRLESLRDSFERSKQDRLRAVMDREAIAATQRATALTALNELDRDRVRLAEALREHTRLADRLLGERTRLVELDKAVTAAKEPFEQTRRIAADASRALEAFDAAYDRLMVHGDCPTCRQPVKAHRQSIARLFGPDREALRSAKEQAVATMQQFGTVYEDAGVEYASQDLRVAQVGPSVMEAARLVAALQERCSERVERKLHEGMAAWEREMVAALEERNTIAGARWDGQGAMEVAEEEATDAEAAREHALGRATKIAIALEMAEYWVEAFGDRGIRSLMAESVADFINARLADHLEALACGELTVKMATTTALKKGGSREGISFESAWGWGGSGVDDGSGGQDRRKDLAVFAAVQDVAEARSARPFPFKAWDEPGDALDARGKEMFLRWVEGQARARGTGLLITHAEDIAAQVEADRIWTVVMADDGARVEVS